MATPARSVRRSSGPPLARFRASLRVLRQRYPREDLAVVTHGTVLTLYVAASNPVDPVAFWEALTMPACAVLTRDDDRLKHILLA